MSGDLLLRDVEVDGVRCDVTIRGRLIHTVAPAGRPPTRGADVVDGHGGALLPGLHDHHVHLLATASAQLSVDCGPDAVRDRDGLAAALAAGTGPDGWVRGVGYHESVAGTLDRHQLDALVPGVPVRVQHRSGALWILNTAALDRVAAALDDTPDVERGDDGRPNGRLWRYDARLRPALPFRDLDLGALGRRLAGYGVTGVTDATPDLDESAVQLLADAHTDGRLPQSVHLLGAPATTRLPPGMSHGPRKLLLRDHDLPTYDQLSVAVETEHSRGRPVAVHCVTRESLLLTLAVLEEVGPLVGDRVEHAGVVPEGVAAWIARLGLRVVTQPVFLHDRGDDYLRDVAPADVPLLYPHASLLAAGVAVSVSSDAPFGALDPWAGIRAAVARTTSSGALIGPHERVPAATALRGMLTRADDPGGVPRRLEAGSPADACLLRVPLAEALREPAAEQVRATVLAGQISFNH